VTTLDPTTQRALRELVPHVLGTIMRRYRDLPGCEDAVQEALIAAAKQWPVQGVPDNPAGWLIHVATRRITDQVRAETARRLRERLVVSLIPADEQIALAADEEAAASRDDTLDLLFLCCHSSLSPASQVALTLRAVGGLTTMEIARAFLVPEATMAQRLSRAKQTIKSSGVGFEELSNAERMNRLSAVRQALYLIFSEGYSATSGEQLHRTDLSNEAIRLTRMLARSVPDDPEVKGLLALMLLTDARRGARLSEDGDLVPLDEQDRSRWDREAIAEGLALVADALPRGAVGPYQIQAAIAALHDEAPDIASTDWPQIVALYSVLLRMADNPMVRLNRAIALAMVEGPAAGLAELDALAKDPRVAEHYRLDAVRGHLYERAGDREKAVFHYQRAASRTTSIAERNHLLLRGARLREESSA
jgi:RNA polymerase sigma factor (sigma-70 family)